MITQFIQSLQDHDTVAWLAVVLFATWLALLVVLIATKEPEARDDATHLYL